MHRNAEKNETRGSCNQLDTIERLLKILQISKAEVRYQLIPDSPSREVALAAVEELLGLDGTTIITATSIQNGLKVTVLNILGRLIAGKALFFASVIASGVRIAKTIYEEVNIDSRIQTYANLDTRLREELHFCHDEALEIQKREALEIVGNLWEDAIECRRNPGKKTILTCLYIGGEWLGGAALGYAGARGGAVIGASEGPLAEVACAVVGSVVGAWFGLKFGASAIKNFRYVKNGISTGAQSQLVSLSETDHVGRCCASLFAGYGIEIGASAEFLHVETKNCFLDLGKVGVNFGISSKGVIEMLELKLVWHESDMGVIKFATGFHLDTGFQLTENFVKFSILGFGFILGTGSYCMKNPFLSVTLDYDALNECIKKTINTC